MDENFVKYLMSAVDCSACGTPYDGANVQILGRRGSLWFLSVYCSVCDSESTIVAILEKGQVAKLFSDFATDDSATLHQVDTIELEDILALHDFLAGFDGDFMSLFSSDEKDDGANGTEFY